MEVQSNQKPETPKGSNDKPSRPGSASQKPADNPPSNNEGPIPKKEILANQNNNRLNFEKVNFTNISRRR